MRFEYWNSGDGTWTWHLKTSVDDVLAHGCPYPSRENCLAAIKLVKLAASALCREVMPPIDDIALAAGEFVAVPVVPV